MPVPGVRIIHATQRNVRFTVTDPNIPYDRPYQCTEPLFGGCGQVHVFKTHHLNVDEVGASIVERVLFDKIKAYLIAFGFSVANDVPEPPSMDVGLGSGAVQIVGTQHHIPVVRGEEIKGNGQ